MLFHQPDFYAQADLNKDGKKEIINFGEHYHTDYFLGDQDPAAPKNILGKKVMKYLGMLENVDYDQQTAQKLSRYYSIEGGRLVDKKNNYNYSKLNFDTKAPPYISNSKFVSTFGSAVGDIDNDGDLDYIQSEQINLLIIKLGEQTKLYEDLDRIKNIFQITNYGLESSNYNIKMDKNWIQDIFLIQNIYFERKV